jgi:hypothetical protein
MARSTKFAVIALVAAVLFAGAAGGALVVRAVDSASFSQSLRDGLVESCEENGNPLREAVQSLLREQVVRASKTPASFFPGIPPAVFHQLVQEQAASNQALIASIQPVDCPAQYP